MNKSDIDAAIVNAIALFLRKDGNFNEFNRDDIQLHAGRALAQQFGKMVDECYFAAKDRLTSASVKLPTSDDIARAIKQEEDWHSAERRAEQRAEDYMTGFDRD